MSKTTTAAANKIKALLKCYLKSIHLYEVKLIDGTLYRCEITYRDDKMIIIKSSAKDKDKIRLYNNGILSIRELGWVKVPVVVGGH